MTRGRGRRWTARAEPLRPSPETSAHSGAGDLRQLAVAAAAYSVLTGLAYWRPPVGRCALGVFMAVMGVGVNGSLTAFAPERFGELARRAPWAWYRGIGRALTEPAPRVFGSVMAVGETALATAVLSRGRAARLGLLGTAAFSVVIMPLGVFTLANPVLAAGALHLARRAWPTAAFVRSGTGTAD